MPTKSTPRIVQVYRLIRLVLHFLWAIPCVLCLFPLLPARLQRQIKQYWSRRLLAILAITIRTTGQHIPTGNMLVANHVSWLDIFALNALRPAAFISKSEVRQWPLIGWLATKNDTVFLQRGSRGHAKIVNAKIDALLNDNVDVALFPEGTTTDGTHLLGFHAALLQPAVETAHPVLPIAISYLDPMGHITTAPSYAGETTMGECLKAILACQRLTVLLETADVIETRHQSRKEVSQAAHEAIAALLATKPGFHRAKPVPEKSDDPPASPQ